MSPHGGNEKHATRVCWGRVRRDVPARHARQARIALGRGGNRIETRPSSFLSFPPPRATGAYLLDRGGHLLPCTTLYNRAHQTPHHAHFLILSFPSLLGGPRVGWPWRRRPLGVWPCHTVIYHPPQPSSTHRLVHIVPQVHLHTTPALLTFAPCPPPHRPAPSPVPAGGRKGPLGAAPRPPTQSVASVQVRRKTV